MILLTLVRWNSAKPYQTPGGLTQYGSWEQVPQWVRPEAIMGVRKPHPEYEYYNILLRDVGWIYTTKEDYEAIVTALWREKHEREQNT